VLVLVWFVLMLVTMAVLQIPQSANEFEGMIQMVNVGIGLAFVSYAIALLTARALVRWSRGLSDHALVLVFSISLALTVLLMWGFTAFSTVSFE
jgi:hypothetical protein